MTIEKLQTLKELNLSPEAIGKIDFIDFSRELGAPFNLNVFLDSYEIYGDGKTSLIENLINPSIMEPYYRWQFTRRVVNPLWAKGSGFEGHLIGLSQEEIFRILSDEEKKLWKSAKINGFERALRQIVEDPKYKLNLDEARNLNIAFEKILARMRAKRSELQSKGIGENFQYQNMVYSQASTDIMYPIHEFKDNRLFIGSKNPSVSNTSNNGILGGDIRYQYPGLAEIGRFGFPPLKTLLGFVRH